MVLLADISQPFAHLSAQKLWWAVWAKQNSDIYTSSPVPATGLRGMYFPSTTKGVRRVASSMIALAAVGTSSRTATSNYTDHSCRSN